MTATAAHAQPAPGPPAVDPRAQCESPEVGGIFISGVANELPRSVCYYTVEGYAYYDNYENGAYTGTTTYRSGAQVPTDRPAITPPLSIPQRGVGLVPF